MVSTDYGGPTYDDLDDVLNEYDPDEIRVMSSHDGFRIYEDEGDSNLGDELLWSWDPAHDREPFAAMETLFERLGYGVEVM